MTHTIADRLRAAGMNDGALEAKTALFERAAKSLREIAGSASRPSHLWVPGRIEFLGKHTDYAGGRSLLCAVDRGFAFVFSPRDDNTLRVRDAQTNETFECPINADIEPQQGHWSHYAVTVARRVARNFPEPPISSGADI